MQPHAIRKLLSLAVTIVGWAAPAYGDPTTRPAATPIKWNRPIEQKCFYLLSTLADEPSARPALQDDTTLSVVTGMKQALIQGAKSDRAGEIVAAARWSDAEIADVGKALVGCLAKTPAARDAVAGRLRAGGMYVRESVLSDDELISFAWKSEAKAMNHILDVYGDGTAPAYPKIDAISFDPKSAEWAGKVKALAGKAGDHGLGDLFFDSPMKFALGLLELNGRDEAGRFEPMSEGENRAALAKSAAVDWAKFTYSCILVPGLGPEKAGVALDPAGRARVELAAEEFRAGKAPFIIVSGGYVHPNKTPFCEAIEMRRELLDKLGVPADSVLIEPHARHTTTNLRNGSRLIYRYGFPMDKPVLVTTDANQLGMIAAAAFAKRNLKELGYEPATIGKRVSAKEIEVLPNIESLEADPMSPLDP